MMFFKKCCGVKVKDVNTILYITDTLHTVHNTIRLPENKKYRYIMYAAPENQKVELAELYGYQKNAHDEPLKATITGIPELKGIHREITNLITDSDFLSYYLSVGTGEKLIFDFGEPVVMDRLFFSPRSDDNYIRINDSYELFYHAGKNGWVSLGKQTATDTILHYKNVPANALLWLHNETRGKEEQVFYYKDGIQVFAYDL